MTTTAKKTVTLKLTVKEHRVRKTARTVIAFDALGVERWFDDKFLTRKSVDKKGTWTIEVVECSSLKAWEKAEANRPTE